MTISSLNAHLEQSMNGSRPRDPSSIARLFRTAEGTPDPMLCAELFLAGRTAAERFLTGTFHCSSATARDTAAEILRWNVHLTGAEVVAALFADAAVEQVFVYAGTSELALCDAIEEMPGVELVNGRGDKESAFMAAGASLLRPNRGAAILHGARGLTNAAGGVADARRNEAGTVYVIGLPSTSSERYLPPHGERDLLGAMGTFADWSWQAPPIPAEPRHRDSAARRFVAQLRDALAFTAEPPARPALFGIPQDVGEKRWLPLTEIAAIKPPRRGVTDVCQPAMNDAVRALRHAERPVVLVDDYALRYPGLRRTLNALSRSVGAPVLQLRYRRGPMLFERIQRDEVTNFVGWLNQFSPEHMALLDSADLLLTVEDRNIYERVVGKLPGCRKIAVNTDPEKVLKNDYLGDDGVLVVGNPTEVLAELAHRLKSAARQHTPPWFPGAAANGATATPEPASAPVDRDRRAIGRLLGQTLASWRRPVLVDDSQMFGGLLSECYDDFPRGLRVFGSHGGFVGSGLSYATGLSIANPEVRVMCTLGDQGFTNSLQGLVAAVQQHAKVLFVVCNNGEAVSLKKQAGASFGDAERPYLTNVPGFSYTALARSLGIPAARVEVPVGGLDGLVDKALGALSLRMNEAAAAVGPTLIELVLPSDQTMWRGIWLTQGFEQRQAVAA